MRITVEIPYLTYRQVNALSDAADSGDTELVMRGRILEAEHQMSVAQLTCKPTELRVVKRSSGRQVKDLLARPAGSQSGSGSDSSPRPSSPRPAILEPLTLQPRRSSHPRTIPEQGPTPFDEAYARAFPGQRALPR